MVTSMTSAYLPSLTHTYWNRAEDDVERAKDKQRVWTMYAARAGFCSDGSGSNHRDCKGVWIGRCLVLRTCFCASRPLAVVSPLSALELDGRTTEEVIHRRPVCFVLGGRSGGDVLRPQSAEPWRVRSGGWKRVERYALTAAVPPHL